MILDNKENNKDDTPPPVIQLLQEMLPRAASYNGETMVIVLTGKILQDHGRLTEAMDDIIHLQHMGIYPIVVHGDYDMTEEIIRDWGMGFPIAIEKNTPVIPRRRRIDAVEMVLRGYINKQLVAICQRQGGYALGISGTDTNLIEAKKSRRIHRTPNSNIDTILDGIIEGEPTMINPEILMALEETEIIPFIAPLGSNDRLEVFHLCPAACGGLLSSALVADKLLIYTDQSLKDAAGEEVISELTTAEAQNLLQQGTLSANHHTALKACLQAVSQHTGVAYILDGTLPHSLLLELFSSKGTGTCVTNLYCSAADA